MRPDSYRGPYARPVSRTIVSVNNGHHAIEANNGPLGAATRRPDNNINDCTDDTGLIVSVACHTGAAGRNGRAGIGGAARDRRRPAGPTDRTALPRSWWRVMRSTVEAGRQPPVRKPLVKPATASTSTS